MDFRKLFDSESLKDQLEGRRDAFLKEISRIPQAQFDASTDDEVVAHIAAKAALAPISLHEDRAWLDFEDTRVDVSKDSRRIFHEHPSGPFYIPGRRAVICIPFSGEEWIFDYRTNPRYPHATLRGAVTSGTFENTDSVVRVISEAPNDEHEHDFERQIELQRKLLRELVQYAGFQVRGFNEALETHIRREVGYRRERSSQHNSIAERLNIPIRRNPAAPPNGPVTVAPRYIPPLASNQGAEFGITEEDCKTILHFIRHQGRTYEATPDTYAMHNEEGLRDIVLGQLNGYFRGAATGETFRCRGKTDIRIEAGDRSAFVAECKLWTGSAAIQQALTQLLSYVMWRDSKAALVVFNKSKTKMSSVVTKLPEAITSSGLCTGQIAEIDKGEWSVPVRSAADKDHSIMLRIFAFDIHARKAI